MLLEQRAALTLGHPAPDPELHAVVEGIGAAFGDNRAVPADHCGFALRGTSDEQLVGIGGSAQRFGHPGNTGFPIDPLNGTVYRY